MQLHGWTHYHTKWNKSDRERQIWYHLYEESEKKDTNELIYKTEIDSRLENNLTVTKAEGGWVGKLGILD